MSTEADKLYQEARKNYEAGKIRKSSVLLKKASSRGHKAATGILADDYWFGRDARKCKLRAMWYIRRQAQMGDVDAAWTICHFLHDHKWIPGSKKKKIKYLKMIADSEPDQEHYEFIKDTAKLVSVLVSEDKNESLRYREKYEALKRDSNSSQSKPLQPK